ncbi:MAG: YkgJ family cysteine cluster protein [Desulfosudis oleivorans]|nr:YkgJ family cysteine cluster protein [Desulfosudis oleivorans]
MKASRKTGRTGTLKRLRFPDAEKAQPWLPMLLDAYAIADEGIMTAVRERTAETGERLACSKGCDACCRTHRDIPVYPLELVGIYWFVVEMLTGEVRGSVKKQLVSHGGDDPCPFLVEGTCAIHPLRPMACRQFNVFNRPCGEGEDAFHSRRQDVLTPLQESADRAFAIMLPLRHYRGRGEEEGHPERLPAYPCPQSPDLCLDGAGEAHGRLRFQEDAGPGGLTAFPLYRLFDSSIFSSAVSNRVSPRRARRR